MSLLQSKNLTIGYDGRQVAENISFTVDRGDYLCIVGENGAGKSTLMKTVLSLQPSISGELIFGDGLGRTEIGYLPQQTVIQRDFPATVREIVLSGFQGSNGFKPFYSKDQKEQAKVNIEKMGISELTKKCYRNLSGGQQQKVLLARALCATRTMLLLDEPVSGLDPKATADMYELIDKLNKEDKITVIMISHDIESSLEHATKVLHIGKKSFFGTKAEYLDSDLGKRYLAFEGGTLGV